MCLSIVSNAVLPDTSLCLIKYTSHLANLLENEISSGNSVFFFDPYISEQYHIVENKCTWLHVYALFLSNWVKTHMQSNINVSCPLGNRDCFIYVPYI